LVALTFDDGPNPKWTPAVLDILEHFDVRATFFLQGDRIEAHAGIVTRIVACGHEVGNHGYDHKRRNAPNQAALGDRALRDAGVRTRLFRPPGGALNAGHLLRLTWAGFTTVLWSFDSRDSMRDEGKWTGPVPRYGDIAAGDIVLMHDDNATCVRELPALLAILNDRGLQSVAVSRLLASRS
jgi:peptidoglycan/xylan/chitin deacetylase (PgdA/CDA1 family)